MQEAMLTFLNQFGYWGILLLILAETVFPPIPSEVILLFGGFMTTRSDMNPWWAILFATIGSVAGALLLYAFGRLFSAERIKRLCDGKIGRLLRLKAADIDKANAWFSRYEGRAVLLCRCVPIVRSLISIPAGMSRMKLTPFLVLTTVGSAVWNTVLVWLGVGAGAAWEQVVQYFDWYSKIALVVLVILLGIGVWLFLKKRRRNDAATNKER